MIFTFIIISEIATIYGYAKVTMISHNIAIDFS